MRRCAASRHSAAQRRRPPRGRSRSASASQRSAVAFITALTILALAASMSASGQRLFARLQRDLDGEALLARRHTFAAIDVEQRHIADQRLSAPTAARTTSAAFTASSTTNGEIARQRHQVEFFQRRLGARTFRARRRDRVEQDFERERWRFDVERRQRARMHFAEIRNRLVAKTQAAGAARATKPARRRWFAGRRPARRALRAR